MKSRWLTRILFLFLAFSSSAYLSLYLSDRTFSVLPSWQSGNDITRSDENFSSSASVWEPAPESNSQPLFGAPTRLRSVGLAESHKFSCVDLSAGAITRVPNTSVYRWVDDSGQVHFADREPDSAMLTEVIGLGGERDQYFDLDINSLSAQVPQGFRGEVEQHANNAYEMLAGLVSELQRNKVSLNVMLVDGRSEFEAYAESIGYSGAKNAAGFYRMGNNQAVVLMDSDADRTLAVATHESVHVINAGLYGIIPRWLNEGLADYLEGMTISGQVMEISWRSKWSSERGEWINLPGLISASDEDWDGPNRQRLYASSRAFVYFLLSTSEGKAWVKDYLTLKSARVCDHLSERPFFNLHFGSVEDADHYFRAWVQGAIPPVHLY